MQLPRGSREAGNKTKDGEGGCFGCCWPPPVLRLGWMRGRGRGGQVVGERWLAWGLMFPNNSGWPAVYSTMVRGRCLAWGGLFESKDLLSCLLGASWPGECDACLSAPYSLHACSCLWCRGGFGTSLRRMARAFLLMAALISVVSFGKTG